MSAQGASGQTAGEVSAAARAKESKPQISAKDAEALFKSVGEVMKFASKDTELPIQREVAKKLIGRDDVEADVSKRLNEDEDSRRLERASVVLKKFRFLPADFRLREFEISLMREQVAGYYNIKDKTIYLLNWIEARNQMPIMAHELTHALQDQNFNLETWDKPKERDEKASPDNDADPNEDAIADEQSTARVAMVEGQGMAVLLDYILEPSGHTLVDSPQIVEALKASMTADSDSPILNSAPLYLRESLIFPYREGLTFIQAVMFKSKRKGAFAGTFADPPLTTRAILHPKAYFEHERLAPLPFPKLGTTLGEAYQRYDAGAIGEFDLRVFLRQFESETLANDIAQKWRGGLYVAELNCRKTRCGKAAVSGEASAEYGAQDTTGGVGDAGSKDIQPAKGIPRLPFAPLRVARDDKSDQESGVRGQESGKSAEKSAEKNAESVAIPTSAVGLIYLSRWTDASAARRFADAYANILLKRYKFAQGQAQPTQDDKQALPTRQAWVTDEGLVTVEVRADEVLVLESFDGASTKKISEKVWDAQSASASAGNPQEFSRR